MGTGSKRKSKYVITAIFIVALFAVQFLFSRLGFLISQLFDYSSLDPDNLFAQVAVHHIIQMLCALALIFIIWKAKKTEGFNLRPRVDSKGLKDTLLFCLAITVYYLVVYIIGSFTNTISTYDYALNAVNVSGTLGFQLLLSGPSGNAEYNSAPAGEAVVDTLTPKGYVSVDLFKSFYGLDDEIDDRLIEDFILFQQITEDDMCEYDYSKDLVESFDNGDYSQFGYSMNWNELNFQELTLNNKTDITNAIDNARWIYMVFEVPIPDSDETERVTMLSDFHHDMFYYSVDEDNYHNSGRQLALTELAKEIQVDMIPEDAERQNPDRDKYALSYKYDVYIFTYDRKYIHISNDTYYRFHQSFNVYWQLVYYREFNEEFEVSAAGT